MHKLFFVIFTCLLSLVLILAIFFPVQFWGVLGGLVIGIGIMSSLPDGVPDSDDTLLAAVLKHEELLLELEADESRAIHQTIYFEKELDNLHYKTLYQAGFATLYFWEDCFTLGSRNVVSWKYLIHSKDISTCNHYNPDFDIHFLTDQPTNLYVQENELADFTMVTRQITPKWQINHHIYHDWN